MATHGAIDVSALRIRDGARVAGQPDELGNIGICHCGRDRGSLYVLVNAEGAESHDLEETLAATIIQSFQQSSASTTLALGAAIKAANTLLYGDNKMSFGPQRTLAGVYAVLVRPGHPLVLAYAGPAVALLVGPDGIERMFEEEDAEGPRRRGQTLQNELGVKQDVEVSFFQAQFNPGDVLALATPSLLDCGLDDEELANALSEDGAEGLPANCDMTVLALRYTGQAAMPIEAEAVQPAQASLGRRVGAAGGQALQGLAGLLRRSSSAAPTSAGPDAVPAAKADAGSADIPAWLNQQTTQRQHAGRVSSPAAGRPRVQMPALGSRWRTAAVLLAVLAVVAAAIWWQARSADLARQHKFQSLVSEAQDKRTLGLASLDRGEALANFDAAESLIAQALQMQPDSAAALSLRDGIIRDRDDAKGITRLSTAQVTTLYTFTATGAGPGRVVGDGFNLYVLDKGDQKVYKFVLNPQGNGVMPGGDSVLVRKGDQLGGKVVGDLVDIAWVPAGGSRSTGSLVILESGQKLIQYDVTKGLTVWTLKNTSTWRKVQITGGYGGNFYVLDNLASSILRYRSTTRGYDEAPTSYLQTKIELASAVDMAIDGDIFVLMVNGQVTWLSKGRPQAYPLEGLDRPLSAPVALFTNDGSQSVYVADPSNARVVKLSKQGVVQRQLVYEEGDSTFQRLRGIFADEKKLSLYVTAGTKLLQMGIPK